MSSLSPPPGPRPAGPAPGGGTRPAGDAGTTRAAGTAGATGTVEAAGAGAARCVEVGDVGEGAARGRGALAAGTGARRAVRARPAPCRRPPPADGTADGTRVPSPVTGPPVGPAGPPLRGRRGPPCPPGPSKPLAPPGPPCPRAPPAAPPKPSCALAPPPKPSWPPAPAGPLLPRPSWPGWPSEKYGRSSRRGSPEPAAPGREPPSGPAVSASVTSKRAGAAAVSRCDGAAGGTGQAPAVRTAGAGAARHAHGADHPAGTAATGARAGGTGGTGHSRTTRTGPRHARSGGGAGGTAGNPGTVRAAAARTALGGRGLAGREPVAGLLLRLGAGLGRGLGGGGGGRPVGRGPRLGRGLLVPGPLAPPPTGLRTTTGGMGRDPGMLIRIRVVSVVSVFFSSGRVPERPAPVPSSEAKGVPYGGVPEGYAAPPRPLGPEDGVSVSRLKAGSPSWLRRPSRPLCGRLGGAHHHTGHLWRLSHDRRGNPHRTRTCAARRSGTSLAKSGGVAARLPSGANGGADHSEGPCRRAGRDREPPPAPNRKSPSGRVVVSRMTATIQPAAGATAPPRPPRAYAPPRKTPGGAREGEQQPAGGTRRPAPGPRRGPPARRAGTGRHRRRPVPRRAGAAAGPAGEPLPPSLTTPPRCRGRRTGRSPRAAPVRAPTRSTRW